MSQREVIRMTDGEVAEYLKAGFRARVATIGRDGAPHVVPISYCMLDGNVAFWSDRDSQKVVNLRRDPRVACIIDDGVEFQELRGVEIRGTADVYDDRDLSLRVADLFCERVPEEHRDMVRGHLVSLADERVVISVKPDQVISWDHAKLAGVRPQDIGR